MKRGQAALEFLSTYGFAFLVILVMIGALTYFGVFNVSNFLPQRCLVGQEMECRDWQVQQTAANELTVKFILANNLGNSVQFNSTAPGDNLGNASISIGAGTDTAYCRALESGVIYDGVVTVGTAETQEFQCIITSSAIPAVGEKVKIALDLNYKPTGGAYTDPLAGEIFAPVQ